jgi:hypothetical protein
MIYDFDALRRDVNDVAALLHTFHSPANSLAVQIYDSINRAQSLYEINGSTQTVTALVNDVERNMVELRALINSANA